MSELDVFDYELPPAAIAQHPVEPRDSSRLLDASGSDVAHRTVADFASLVGPGDVIVANNTRVIPARLRLFKATGGAVEAMLIEPGPTPSWHALVRPSRRVPPGTTLADDRGRQVLTVGEDLGDGLRVVTAVEPAGVLALAHEVGATPLPPYITEPLADAERYQTVYARDERSVAAPTAGLHFTPELLDECRSRGAQVHHVELAVGLGTFRPILADRLDDHEMHAEVYRVDQATLDACAAATRVIAIGTTTVRALESAATSASLEGSTELFIRPGYDFKVVDVLFTNFHQPKSSLLVMLAAFAGDRWKQLYDEALGAGYRFLSFGDAMIVSRL